MVDRTRTRPRLCACLGAALALALTACFNPQASDTTATTDTTTTTDTAEPTSQPTGTDTTPPPTTGTTTPEPTTSSICDCPEETPYCLPGGVCVDCEGLPDDANCAVLTPETPLCHAALKLCVGCMTLADCAPGQVCHPDLNTCEQCVLDSDCTKPETPHCDQTTFECTTCVTDDDCDPAAPVCDAITEQCRGCQEHSECGEANACDIFNGTCFPPEPMTTHLYVDDAENCAAVPCSQTTPCCELSQALAPGIVDATMHTIIHVAAGAYHGQAQVAVDATRIAILAETGAVLDTLTIGTPVFLSGTSALFVAGLTVATSDLQNTPGVDCLASAGGLWFDDGVIIGYGGSGVHAAECTATVRRSKILRNANGVLAGPGGKILLRNSMIAGPHTGMAASTVGTGQLNLLYTTLTDHNALTDNHLLACELMGPLVIRNSILFDRKPDLLLLPCPYSLETTAYRTGAFELNGNPTIPTDAPNEVFVDFDADLVDLRSTAVTAPLLDYAVWQTEDPQTDIYGAPRPSEPGAPDVPGANLPTR